MRSQFEYSLEEPRYHTKCKRFAAFFQCLVGHINQNRLKALPPPVSVLIRQRVWDNALLVEKSDRNQV